MKILDTNKTLVEKLVCVKKHSRTIKGGRIMSWSALVVVGDGEGRVGFSRGKGKEVTVAVQKATNKAKRSMADISLNKGSIWYSMNHSFGSTKIFLAPAAKGTGIIASFAMRCVFEALGVQNVLTKVYGSSTPMNVVRATLEALSKMSPASHFAYKRGLHPSVFFEKPTQFSS